MSLAFLLCAFLMGAHASGIASPGTSRSSTIWSNNPRAKFQLQLSSEKGYGSIVYSSYPQVFWTYDAMYGAMYGTFDTEDCYDYYLSSISGSYPQDYFTVTGIAPTGTTSMMPQSYREIIPYLGDGYVPNPQDCSVGIFGSSNVRIATCYYDYKRSEGEREAKDESDMEKRQCTYLPETTGDRISTHSDATTRFLVSGSDANGYLYTMPTTEDSGLRRSRGVYQPPNGRWYRVVDEVKYNLVDDADDYCMGPELLWEYRTDSFPLTSGSFTPDRSNYSSNEFLRTLCFFPDDDIAGILDEYSDEPGALFEYHNCLGYDSEDASVILYMPDPEDYYDYYLDMDTKRDVIDEVATHCVVLGDPSALGTYSVYPAINFAYSRSISNGFHAVSTIFHGLGEDLADTVEVCQAINDQLQSGGSSGGGFARQTRTPKKDHSKDERPKIELSEEQKSFFSQLFRRTADKLADSKREAKRQLDIGDLWALMPEAQKQFVINWDLDTIIDDNLPISELASCAGLCGLSPDCAPGCFGGPDECKADYCILCGQYDVEGCGYVRGDPHFVGSDNEKYEVMGTPGNFYTILSDSTVQINAEYQEGCRAGSSTIKRVGVVTADGQNFEFTAFRDSYTVMLNGIELPVSEIGSRMGDFVVYHKSSDAPTHRDADKGTVIVTNGQYTFEFTQHRSRCDIGGVNIGVQFTDSATRPHGLLGQTHRAAGEREVRSNMRRFPQGENTIEGSVTDYQVDDIFATEFKFTRFARQ